MTSAEFLPSMAHLPPSERLSIPFRTRLPLMTGISATAGFCLGITHGSNESGLRFRAENAHRLPTTQTGWYLYHKSKNYHAMLGGMKEGLKMGLRLGVWSCLFVGMEEGLDRGRAALVRAWRIRVKVDEEERMVAGNRDFVSTVLAGMGTAGMFSAWCRLPLPTATRLTMTGAKAGLAFGLIQDALTLAKGKRLGYVEFGKRLFGGKSSQLEVEEGATAVAG